MSSKLKRNKFEETIKNVIPNDIIEIIKQYYPIYIEFNKSKLGLIMNEKQTLTEYLTKVLIEDKNKSYIISEELLYDGLRDGFEPYPFHSKCDLKSNTLTIIKTNYNHIFAGFTTIPFNKELDE